jgi:hypothetical protein
LLTPTSHWLPIRQTNAITKGLPSRKKQPTKKEAGMKCNQIRVVLDMPKGSTDVIVTKVNFLQWIRDTKVPNPYQIELKGTSENDLRLVALMTPIVDSETSRERAK